MTFPPGRMARDGKQHSAMGVTAWQSQRRLHFPGMALTFRGCRFGIR